MRSFSPACIGAITVMALRLLPTLSAQEATARNDWPTFLKPDDRYGKGAFSGTYPVFEDRVERQGRKIGLHIVILPATEANRQSDPIFLMAGGPGQAASSVAKRMTDSWMRKQRDLVFIDQRGTGQSNPLHVQLKGSDNNLQGYLDPIFDLETFKQALPELGKIADLTQYTTPIAMDDIDEARQALGYQKINLVGGSYGSRASLIYIRRHPESVRTATLTGIAPISFKNPLFHASSAQEGLELVFAECEQNPRYQIYKGLRNELDTIFSRLSKQPARVEVSHPVTGELEEVMLTRNAFAETLRMMLYVTATNRKVPSLIHKAYGGDYTEFANTGIRRNRMVRNMLAFGMLMTVIGSEDIPRITEEEIEPLTQGTFLGDHRVRSQMAATKIWPQGDVPENYGEPVRGDMPVLFISGSLDPVTPPPFGVAAAKHFPNGMHIVVPEAHGTSNARVEQLKQEFLKRGSTKGLDTSFIAKMKLPVLSLPKLQ